MNNLLLARLINILNRPHARNFYSNDRITKFFTRLCLPHHKSGGIHFVPHRGAVISMDCSFVLMWWILVCLSGLPQMRWVTMITPHLLIPIRRGPGRKKMLLGISIYNLILCEGGLRLQIVLQQGGGGHVFYMSKQWSRSWWVCGDVLWSGWGFQAWDTSHQKFGESGSC